MKSDKELIEISCMIDDLFNKQGVILEDGLTILMQKFIHVSLKVNQNPNNFNEIMQEFSTSYKRMYNMLNGIST